MTAPATGFVTHLHHDYAYTTEQYVFHASCSTARPTVITHPLVADSERRSTLWSRCAPIGPQRAGCCLRRRYSENLRGAVKARTSAAATPWISPQRAASRSLRHGVCAPSCKLCSKIDVGHPGAHVFARYVPGHLASPPGQWAPIYPCAVT